ncbi:hypothetical protein SteCoe_11345 [Stentor coeruleus]|uniref:NET domain-containing protein n=1 Tax=Stentor coeruleus TaxID=5963 RepID=A0A1R2CDD6_9CILI|nr:hypothetical protein SteCoe_11345 [Stentor coeruleus]
MKDSTKEIFKSAKSKNQLEGNMEFSARQAQVINSLLPGRIRMEFLEQKISRTRRSEIEVIQAANLPEKRVTREKEPEFLNGQSEGFKKCYKFLQNLKRSPLSKIFWNTETMHKNFDPIEELVDLNIVENKLISGGYLSAYHLGKDIRTMISNSFQTNSQNTKLFLETFEFNSFFESSFQDLEAFIFNDNIIQELTQKIDSLTQDIKDSQNKNPQIMLLKDKKMTSIEKKQLVQSLKKLDPKYLSGVLKIVKGCMNIQGDELEFDLENLPNKVCRDLEKYIKQCLQIKQTNKPLRKGQNDIGKNEVLIQNTKKQPEPASESSESSSSSIESEDDMPGAPVYFDKIDHDISDYHHGISFDYSHY